MIPWPSGALADVLGQADAVLKGAEAECKALKDEIKRRGLLEAAGDSFAIRVAEQISDAHLLITLERHPDDTRTATVSAVGGDWAQRLPAVVR